MSEHAMRLREMAERFKTESEEFRQGWIGEGYHPQNPRLTSRIEKYTVEIAALIAGAEALERAEMAELRQFREKIDELE